MKVASTAARMARVICPYLEVGGSRWRHAAPSRDHRCQAIVPAPPLTTDKQRRLCLGAAHTTCPSYLSAVEVRRAWAGGDRPEVAPGTSGRPEAPANRWGLRRTAPVVAGVNAGTHPIELLRHRWLAQIGLVGLLVVAFVAVAISRGSGDGSSGALLVATATAVAVATASPSSSSPSPTAAPSAVPTAAPTATFPPSSQTPATTQYRVVSGDTLSGLAGRFRTTVRALMDLNGLTSTTLRVGQLLRVPGAPTVNPAPPASPGVSPGAAG